MSRHTRHTHYSLQYSCTGRTGSRTVTSPFIRNFPYSNLKRYSALLIEYCIITLPESIWIIAFNFNTAPLLLLINISLGAALRCTTYRTGFSMQRFITANVPAAHRYIYQHTLRPAVAGHRRLHRSFTIHILPALRPAGPTPGRLVTYSAFNESTGFINAALMD